MWHNIAGMTNNVTVLPLIIQGTITLVSVITKHHTTSAACILLQLRASGGPLKLYAYSIG